MSATSTTWVFGYGSLIWRPSFPYLRREPAYVLGWARRFWQGSTDHRGVPGAPGRVVTLVAAPGSRCEGLAYALDATQLHDALAELDHREQGGYARLELPLHFAGRSELGLVYIATPDNPEYLGEAPLEAIAAQVRSARGPSGENVEYVLRLADALTSLGAHDEHVESLARLLR